MIKTAIVIFPFILTQMKLLSERFYICFFLICLSWLYSSQVWSKGSMTYGNIQHLNDPQLDGAGSQWVDFSYYSKKESGRFLLVADADLRFYPDAKTSTTMFSASELYIDYHMGRSNLSFGRRILDWDPAEKYWNLGNLNSQRGFNLLEQDQEGVMALRLTRNLSGFRAEVFGSFVHVPQLNPSLNVEDGRIVSSNPWAKLPPKSAGLQGVEIPIFYDLEIPSYQKLLLQPSLGARVKVDLGQNTWVSTHYAWKPENTLRVNATGYYEQDTVERAYVRARPFVNHHQVAGAVFVTQLNEQISLQGSYTTIIPDKVGDEDFKFEALKIQPNYYDEAYARAAVVWDNKISTFSINAIERLKGEIKIDDILGTKPRWKRAVGFYVKHNFNDALGLSGDWKYDTVLKDIVLKQDAWWNIDKHVSLGIGMELIQSPKSYSYWHYVRSNDSFYSSATYSF